MWLLGLGVLVLGGLFVSVHRRNRKAARLYDSTPICSPGLHHYVSLLQLKPAGPVAQHDGATPAALLRDAVERNDGRLAYLGTAVTVMDELDQFLPSCDVLAYTTWSKPSDFEAFREEVSQTWAVHRAQPFHRPVPTNLMIGAVMHGVAPLVLGIKAALSDDKYDLTERSTVTDNPKVAAHKWEDLQKLADLCEAGPADEPLVFWNFEPEEMANPSPTDIEYAKGAMPILMANGAGAVHGGFPLPQSKGGIGSFGKIVAMYYPSREMATRLLRSKCYNDIYHFKTPAKRLIVITVPHPSQYPAGSTRPLLM